MTIRALDVDILPTKSIKISSNQVAIFKNICNPATVKLYKYNFAVAVACLF